MKEQCSKLHSTREYVLQHRTTTNAAYHVLVGIRDLSKTVYFNLLFKTVKIDQLPVCVDSTHCTCLCVRAGSSQVCLLVGAYCSFVCI